MQPDDKFFNHLAILHNGLSRQDVYKKYKNASDNYCFQLNGALRGGTTTAEDLIKFEEISSIIRAKNIDHLRVYRMTSDSEFTPSGPKVMLGEAFRYPCFLSTTRSTQCLPKFYPSLGVPTVLEINIPPGTTMALMENGNNAVSEEEILLGSGTEFKITSAVKMIEPAERALYVGNANLSKCTELYYLSMYIVSNPPHLNSTNPSEFFMW